MTKVKQIIDKTFTFCEFLNLLSDNADNDSVIRNIIIQDCVVKDVPKRFQVFLLTKPKKFLFITIYEGTATFCGFEVDHCIIKHCNFIAKGSKVKSYD